MWNFYEVYTQYIFEKTLEKFRFLSIFPKCGIFQRSTLSNFDETLEKFGSYHRYFLSVEFFKGPHLVHSRWNSLRSLDLSSIFSKCGNSSEVHTQYIFDETFEKFGLSSIISKCVEFFRGTPLSTFSMKLLRSLDFHWYFQSVEFFRGPHLVHSRWNSREVWSFIDIF